ncbi:MAG: hypothetical protein Q9195_009085 [Heterodermia aff. obscurata]
MESAPTTPTLLDEKPGLSSPLTYDGSTIVSARSPKIRHFTCRDKYQWHKRLGWNKTPKPSPKPIKATIIRKLEDHPIGYPRQAAFADSDESFAIYRRFGYLHARLLMHRQDELRELEEKLGGVDTKDNRDESRQRRLTSRHIDDVLSRREEQGVESRGAESRSAILAQIEEKILKYENTKPFDTEPGQLLQQSQALIGMNKPPVREQKSLQNYLENRQCLCEAEAAFAYHKEDLVTLRPGRDHSFVDAFVEDLLKRFPCRPLKALFCSKETASKSHDPKVRYFTRGRINAFVTLIITSIILLLLVVPIWLLYHISVTLNTNRSNVLCMGILLVATLVFSAVLSLFTKARRHEVLAASAG